MLAMTADRKNTIQRASRALLIFFIFMSVITLWSGLANLAHATPTDSLTLVGITFEGAAITDKIHGLWLAQLALGAAIGLKVLYHLIRLLVLQMRGQVFTVQNVSQIRQIGLTYIAAIVIWFLMIGLAWPEIAAARGQWTNVMPSFPGDALVAAFLFLFASHIIDEGRELREEQDLVV